MNTRRRRRRREPPLSTMTGWASEGRGGAGPYRSMGSVCTLPTYHSTRHHRLERRSPLAHARNNTITDVVSNNGSLWYTFNYTDHFVELLLFRYHLYTDHFNSRLR